jgi:hypothetical protein
VKKGAYVGITALLAKLGKLCNSPVTKLLLFTPVRSRGYRKMGDGIDYSSNGIF